MTVPIENRRVSYKINNDESNVYKMHAIWLRDVSAVGTYHYLYGLFDTNITP